MSTTGISMVRDEIDIVGETIKHMLEQVDEVIVADNLSTDGTNETLYELSRDEPRLFVVDDREVAYYQAQKMTRLAGFAARRGARWVVPFDADEFWTAGHRRIADVLAEQDDDIFIVSADLYDYVVTAEDPEGSPLARIRWRRSVPVSLPKVACRAMPGLEIQQGNHGASFGGGRPGIREGLLTVKHFPYRSGEQFVSKVRNGAAAYAATDLDEGTGAHWRQYGRHLEENGPQAVIDDIFLAHFFSADPLADGLVFDPVE